MFFHTPPLPAVGCSKTRILRDPLDPETQTGSLISTAHRDKVHGYVERGREEGAEVVAGGEFDDGRGAFYKQSGFGRELGLETLELYLETKSVLVSTSARPFKPIRPPSRKTCPRDSPWDMSLGERDD